jgi:hypothetical protein
VWANCLPSLNEDQGVKFYGVEDNKAGDLDADAKDITVSYADAAASFARGEDIVSVNGTNIQSWTLREVTDGVDNLKRLENTSADKRVDPATRKTGAHYILTVNYYVGGSDEYDLVMEAADTAATLVEKSPDGAPVLNGNTFDLSKNGKLDGQTVAVTDMTLPEFLSLFQLTGTNSRVVWQWTTKGNTSFTSEGLTISEDTIPGKVTMDDIKGVVATVYSEDGTIKSTYANTEGTLAASKQAALAAVEAKWNALSAEAKADAGVQAAYEALRNNIKGAADAATLQAYYNNGALTDTAVDSVDSAVEMVGKGTALPEADENGKIVLTQDVVLASRYDLTSGVKEIDLAGHTLSKSTAQSLIKLTGGSTLTITDSVGTGVIAAADGQAAVVVDGSSTLNLKNVKLTSTNNPTIQIQVAGGVVDIDGGSITSTSHDAVYIHGENTQATITIGGGANITSTTDTAMYLAGKGDTTINDATISGKVGVEIRNGTLKIREGAVINSTNPTFDVRGPYGDGTTVNSGVALAVSPHTVANAVTNVYVTGGTLTGTKQIFLANYQNNGTGLVDVDVAGIVVEAETNTPGAGWTKNANNDWILTQSNPDPEPEPEPTT